MSLYDIRYEVNPNPNVSDYYYRCQKLNADKSDLIILNRAIMRDCRGGQCTQSRIIIRKVIIWKELYPIVPIYASRMTASIRKCHVKK